jgi:hypothetical protein
LRAAIAWKIRDCAGWAARHVFSIDAAPSAALPRDEEGSGRPATASGAFGPNGGANRTITVIGTAANILGSPAPMTLVSLFSIAPTSDATVDATGELRARETRTIRGSAAATTERASKIASRIFVDAE